MSREGAQRKEQPAVQAGTPIWVWAVYALGLLAAAIVVFSLLFSLGAYLLSDDVPVTVNTSARGIVVWGGLMAVAGGIWVYRRRRR